MTKKDFQMVADIVSDPTLKLTDAKRTALARRFADRFAADNPRFNMEIFGAACGVNLEKK